MTFFQITRLCLPRHNRRGMTMTEEDLDNILWNITRPWEDRWKTFKKDRCQRTDRSAFLSVRWHRSLGPVVHTRIDHQICDNKQTFSLQKTVNCGHDSMAGTHCIMAGTHCTHVMEFKRISDISDMYISRNSTTHKPLKPCLQGLNGQLSRYYALQDKYPFRTMLGTFKDSPLFFLILLRPKIDVGQHF